MLSISKSTAPEIPEASTTKSLLEKPRRPLSAYNLFFRDEREKLLKESKDQQRVLDKTGCPAGFAGLAKEVAARWKKAEDTLRKKYEDIAAQGRGKYHEQMKLWRAQRTALGLPTKRKNKKRKVPAHRKQPGYSEGKGNTKQRKISQGEALALQRLQFGNDVVGRSRPSSHQPADDLYSPLDAFTQDTIVPRGNANAHLARPLVSHHEGFPQSFPYVLQPPSSCQPQTELLSDNYHMAPMRHRTGTVGHTQLHAMEAADLATDPLSLDLLLRSQWNEAMPPSGGYANTVFPTSYAPVATQWNPVVAATVDGGGGHCDATATFSQYAQINSHTTPTLSQRDSPPNERLQQVFDGGVDDYYPVPDWR